MNVPFIVSTFDGSTFQGYEASELEQTTDLMTHNIFHPLACIQLTCMIAI